MKQAWKAILWISLLLTWSRPAVSQWCVNGLGLPTSGGGNPSPNPVCQLCDREKVKPTASDQTCTNSPCFAATGVFERVGIDLEVPVPSGPPLVLGRLYRTSNVLDGMTGPGWKSSAGARLWAYTFSKGEPNLIEEGAYVTFPDGLRLRFVKQANGTFQPPQGRYDVLTQKPDGNFELTLQRSSTRYRFNQTGAPIEIEDETGNKVIYETDGNGRVTKIRDTSGRYI
ncbi:MAG: RHS repeat protein, partial [Acidobacteria bacterium]|nr:RHS repeat protein [Acidobacteriota bacterium]